MDIRRALLIAGQLGLAGMFLYSGYAKLSEPWLQFAVSIESFKMVPDALLEPMARYLPWLEVVAGLGVLVPLVARWAALSTFLMLCVFTTAGISAYARGLTVDCGCFGAGAADPIGPKWFAEHGAMVLFAAAVTTGLFLEPKMRARAARLTAQQAEAAAVLSPAITETPYA